MINILDCTAYLITGQLLRETAAFSSYYGTSILRITYFPCLWECVWCSVSSPSRIRHWCGCAAHGI